MVKREWVPISTSAKGRLALRALDEFGTRGYEPVSVADLAAAAGVTTGSLYHHFGSKQGLYGFVRDDVERRVLDRMEGAAAARPDDTVRAALLVGFDYAVAEHFARLLSEERADDPIEAFLARVTDPFVARLLAALWRAALRAVADGAASAPTRSALAALCPQT